jgi:hypothetical protein
VPNELGARNRFDADVLYCTESANFSIGLRIDVGDPLFPSSAAREYFNRCMQDHGHQLARDEQPYDLDSLESRAAAGDADAEYVLGTKYLDAGTSRSTSEALYWFENVRLPSRKASLTIVPIRITAKKLSPARWYKLPVPTLFRCFRSVLSEAYGSLAT